MPRASQYQHELFASHARNCVGVPKGPAQVIPKLAQQAVALWVPVTIIDVLEMVQVENGNRVAWLEGLEQHLPQAAGAPPGQGIRDGRAAEVGEKLFPGGRRPPDLVGVVGHRFTGKQRGWY